MKKIFLYAALAIFLAGGCCGVAIGADDNGWEILGANGEVIWSRSDNGSTDVVEEEEEEPAPAVEEGEMIVNGNITASAYFTTGETTEPETTKKDSKMGILGVILTALAVVIISTEWLHKDRFDGWGKVGYYFIGNLIVGGWGAGYLPYYAGAYFPNVAASLDNQWFSGFVVVLLAAVVLWILHLLLALLVNLACKQADKKYMFDFTDLIVKLNK